MGLLLCEEFVASPPDANRRLRSLRIIFIQDHPIMDLSFQKKIYEYNMYLESRKYLFFLPFLKKAFLKEKGKNILVGTFFLVCGVGRKIRCLKDSISQYHSQRSPNISWIAVGWFKVCRVGPSLWQLVLRWEPPCPALQLQSKHVLLGDSWIIFEIR